LFLLGLFFGSWLGCFVVKTPTMALRFLQNKRHITRAVDPAI
jgi:hypothetical protein